MLYQNPAVPFRCFVCGAHLQYVRSIEHGYLGFTHVYRCGAHGLYRLTPERFLSGPEPEQAHGQTAIDFAKRS